MIGHMRYIVLVYHSFFRTKLNAKEEKDIKCCVKFGCCYV